MRYDLTAIRVDIAGAVVAGVLTLHGVTRPIELRASSGGLAQDPYGHDRCGLELRGQLDRRAFGINFDPSGFLVGDDVALAIDLSLVRAASDHHPPQVGLLSAQSTSAPIATRSAGSTSSGSG
jgi:polyisoprenoid-binding protein YceI